MECENCGESVSKQDNYCSNCGWKVDHHRDEHNRATTTEGGYEMQKVYYVCSNDECSIKEKSKESFEEKAHNNSCPYRDVEFY